jgi:hypothetical protein
VKKIAHAWLAMMALKRLEDLKNKKTFSQRFQEQTQDLLEFFSKHRDAFVQGAWFPDDPIGDNLAGGHTLKMRKPDEGKGEIGKEITHEPPNHSSSKDIIEDKERFREKVYTESDSRLADRCEAIKQAIRDMMLIKGNEEKGSPIMFTDNQIALNFLMFSHYIADGHVPPHADARDFYSPPTIHPDMESFWDDEIEKYYKFDTKKEVFVYDEMGYPEFRSGNEAEFADSFISKALQRLALRAWDPSNKKVLGKGNKNAWDYMVATCFVSYLVSTWFIPEMTKAEYNKLKILREPEYKKKLLQLSEHVFADAIDSIALLWILAWDSLHKLKTDIKSTKEEIKARGGKIIVESPQAPSDKA